MNPKHELLLSMLETSWPFLQIDGRAEGVDLPEWLREPRVLLQIGYQMPNPIHDLRVDEEGVGATLSFRRAPWTCRVPWKAIYAIFDDEGRGGVYPEDMPEELLATLTELGAVPNEVAREDTGPRAIGMRRVNAQPLPAQAAAAAPPAAPESKPKRPSHLKLVP